MPLTSNDSNQVSQIKKQSDENGNEAARRRWKLLARALQKSEDISLELDRTPFPKFKSYGLFISKWLSVRSNDSHSYPWYKYFANVGRDNYEVAIRHPVRNFTASELMGFNNTGNICIWPSEEVLAYCILCNLEYFASKTVLELGGGMTCLAGLMVAKYSRAKKIHLTDGNVLAVDNLKYILDQNGFGKTDRVTYSVLQWGDFERLPATPYDIILSADCLFFDDARQDLVETIWSTLKEDGIAIVVAPRRGNTFDKFAEEAKLRGFRCIRKYRYNEEVWKKHLSMKERHDYEEDKHYPLFLQLKKCENADQSFHLLDCNDVKYF